jgi:hypothetical protein
VKNKIEFKVCNQANNPEAYKECEEFIKKWQKILHITDWEITLEFLSANEAIKIMDEDVRAFCTRELQNKSARISINIETGDVNIDIEHTLLHELLHIVTYEYQWLAEEYCDKEATTLLVLKYKLEQMVDSLAKSFVEVGNVVEKKKKRSK